jgi:hypothetical protein
MYMLHMNFVLGRYLYLYVEGFPPPLRSIRIQYYDGALPSASNSKQIGCNDPRHLLQFDDNTTVL